VRAWAARSVKRLGFHGTSTVSPPRSTRITPEKRVSVISALTRPAKPSTLMGVDDTPHQLAPESVEAAAAVDPAISLHPLPAPLDSIESGERA
jgi:hypothetical protein